MKIEFEKEETKILPNFRGGEKEYRAKMIDVDQQKIMKGLLIPGASIGFHKHDGSSEVMFITKGCARFITEDENGNRNVEILKAGDCHICRIGHSHTLINDTNEDIEFYAVVSNFLVPEKKISNETTKKAIAELDDMKKNSDKYKSYNNADELVKDLSK